MYNRILVPLDGSELAEQVLPRVIELAYHTGAQIILLRVPDLPADELLVQAPWLGAAARERAKAEAIEYLDRISSNLSALELDVCIARCDEGIVYETILSKAKELEADLIAMSTHGRSGLARLVMGSVADDVVRHAQLPVLLVRPHPAHSSYPLPVQTAAAYVSIN
jgi:nucleotide-binding universal stress UspA family protein